MKTTTKRKLIGEPMKVASVAVAAGVPLAMLYEMAPKWFKETEPGVALTGVGVIAVLIIGAFLLPHVFGLLKRLFTFLAGGRSQRTFVSVLVICGILFGLCKAVEYLHPLVGDIKTIIFGTSGSVAAGWGINAAGNAISPGKPKNKEEKVNG